MSRSMKASLGAFLMIVASSIFMQDNNADTSKLARAVETPTPIQVQVTDITAHNQLRQLYTERKQILEGCVKEFEVSFKSGRGTKSEYVQAKKAALLAGIDLCNAKIERIEIHQEIVKLYTELEEHDKRRVAAGMIGQQGLRMTRVARLEAEIDLLREELK